MLVKKRLSFLLIILFFVVVISSCIKKEKISIQQEDVNILNSMGNDFKLYYIGKREELLNLNVTYVDSLKEVPFNRNHKHTFLVINNRDNSINLEEQEEEIAKLKENVETNKYCFYYFGNTYIDIFGEHNLYDVNEEIPEWYFGHVLYVKYYINAQGSWDEETEKISKTNKLTFLSEITHEFKHVIKTNS